MIYCKFPVLTKQTRISGLTGLIILITLILLSFQSSYSQYNSVNFITENQINSQGFLPMQEVQINSFQDLEVIPVVHKSIDHFINKTEIGNKSSLDSIYEFKNFGYYNELYRWYYSYDEQFRIDTIWRYHYNSKGEFNNIIEIKTYNTIGQLLKLVKRQPDFRALQFYGDSSIIDYYTEEYKYKGLNLVQLTSLTNEMHVEYVINEYYTYNVEGKLLHDSIVNSNYTVENRYTYNASGDLDYVFNYFNSALVSQVTKYTYDIKDTTKLTTRFWVYYYDAVEIIIPDTIKYWMGHNYYFEEFDHLNRRTSLKVENDNIHNGRSIEFKAEYQYTDKNNLLHASYYNWQGSIDSGAWTEATKIDNNYDENGNLLLYEKTYYDARSEKWETDNSKIYYYSLFITGLSENFTKTKTLGFYPNPVENEIIIKDSLTGISYYTIYNMNGFEIEKAKLENQTINVSYFNQGIYILKIQNGHSFYSGKFLKK